MAQIIRKLSTGDKIKKDQNPSEKIEKNKGITINDIQKEKSEDQNQEITVNDITIPSQPKNKNIIFKVNGQNAGFSDVNEISNLVQDSILNNKQLNYKEASQARDSIENAIKNAKESVDFTKRGIIIDGKLFSSSDNNYKTGWFDNQLKQKQVLSYITDLYLRGSGAIIPQNSYSENSNDFYTSRKFNVPNIIINKSASENSEEEEEQEKTPDQLAVDAFNKKHGTTGTYNKIRFVDPTDDKWKNYYVFDKGNGNYYLATKDVNGNYLKIEDDLTHLRYDDYTNPNYGNIYTGVGGTYRLINKDTVNSEDSEYQSAFKKINDDIENRFSTIIENVKNQFNNKSSYYNPYISTEDKPYINIGTNFSKVGKYSDISSVYIDANSPRTHFGQFDIPSLLSGIIVKGDKAIKVKLTQRDGKYFAIDPNDNNKEYDLGNLSVFQTIGENPYQEINYDYFKDGKDVIGHDDIFNWAGDFRVEDSNDWDRNDDDEFLEYENAIDAITRTVNKLITSPAFYSDFSKNLKANFNGLVNFAAKYKNKHGEDANLYRLRYDIQRLYNYILEKQQASQQVPSQKKGGKLRMYQSGGAYLALKNDPNTVYKDYSKATSPDLVYNPKQGKEYTTLDNEWGWTDALRGVAVGADAAALAGGYIGLGAGIGATALEAVADVADAINGQMEWGTVLKNVGINMGLTILSFIPGASSLKAAKSGIKGGAKLVKSLGKLEKVADVARSAGKIDDAAAIMKAADEALDIKDVKNIITSAESILKNKKIATNLSKDQIDEASALLETCQKAIKIQEKVGNASKVLGTIGQTVNAGMSAYGIGAGAQSIGSIANKLIEDNESDISLGDIHGLIAGVAGVKGTKNLFKTYATRKALVDKTPTNSDINIPLKHGDVEINITSKGKSPNKVKDALKLEIATLKTKQVELQNKVQNSSGGEKATIQGELDQLKKQIKNYETIEANFKTAYDGNWTNTIGDAGNTVKEKFNSFVENFKQPDYTQKRLITDIENPNWIQRKGREYAKKEGFTEEGFTIEDYQIPKGYYQKQLKVDKVKQEVQSQKSETLVERAISKVIKSKSKSGKSVEGVLSELKGDSFSGEQKSKLIEAIKNNKSLNNKDKLIEIVNSLKNGGILKSYQPGGSIGDASSSSKSAVVKKENKPPINNSNNILKQLLQPEINDNGLKVWVDPEMINLSAKAANAWATTNKVYDIQNDLTNVKKEYPYQHLSVKHNLALLQEQKDQFLQNSSRLNSNPSSDNSLNQAVRKEYNSSVANAVAKIKANEAANLLQQRQLVEGRDYQNEIARVDTSNFNNAQDVDLANSKKLREAQKHSTLGNITNATLDQFGQLFSKRMDSAKHYNLAKDRLNLTNSYINSVRYAQDWLSKNQTFEDSVFNEYATLLNLNKNSVITQEDADKLYDYLVQAYPNLSQEEKDEYRSQFNNYVGNTLNKVYEGWVDLYSNDIYTNKMLFNSRNNLLGYKADAGKYYLTSNTFNDIPFSKFKNGGSFKSVKYKSDNNSKNIHKKMALEYTKLLHKQHQENLKNVLPFLLHSYKKSTNV